MPALPNAAAGHGRKPYDRRRGGTRCRLDRLVGDPGLHQHTWLRPPGFVFISRLRDSFASGFNILSGIAHRARRTRF